MTTLRLVKFVVSFAISETPAWVAETSPAVTIGVRDRQR